MLIHSDTAGPISNACRLKIESCKGRLPPRPMDDQIGLKRYRRVSGSRFYNETITISVNRSYGRVKPDIDACGPCRLDELLHKVRVEPGQRGGALMQNANLGSGTGGNVSELKGNVPAADK